MRGPQLSLLSVRASSWQPSFLAGEPQIAIFQGLESLGNSARCQAFAEQVMSSALLASLKLPNKTLVLIWQLKNARLWANILC